MSKYPIISLTPYKNGFFPSIPIMTPHIAIILRSKTKGNMLCISDKTTIREISAGKYDEKIEVDLSKRIVVFIISSPSSNDPYLFDISLTVEVRVIDALSFLMKGVSDIVECIKPCLLPKIRRITREYPIINYVGMDNVLVDKLASEIIECDDTGIEYRVQDASCMPNENAIDRVKDIFSNKLREETEIQRIRSNIVIEKEKAISANELIGIDMVTAIYSKVVSGQISSADAILEIEQYNQRNGIQKFDNFERMLGMIEKLRDEGLITDAEASVFVKEQIKGLPIKENPKHPLPSVKSGSLGDVHNYCIIDFGAGTTDLNVHRNCGENDGFLNNNVTVLSESQSHNHLPPLKKSDTCKGYDRSLKIDEVQFTAFAPNTFIKGHKALINIYMFEELFRQLVEDDIMSKKSLNIITTTGIFQIVKSTKVCVVLESHDVEIKDNIIEAVWNGKYSKFTYDVFLPKDTHESQILFCGTVYFDQVMVTKIKFIAHVSTKSKQRLKVDKIKARSAFISYASQDRSKVAARIQGMTKMAPDLDIFFDIKSLRSGQYWDSILWKEIETRDIFFLFWSRNAKASEYVTKEWQYALKIKGIDAIEPVPLESPEECPPPIELRDKHFNDWMLMYTI